MAKSQQQIRITMKFNILLIILTSFFAGWLFGFNSQMLKRLDEKMFKIQTDFYTMLLELGQPDSDELADQVYDIVNQKA